MQSGVTKIGGCVRQTTRAVLARCTQTESQTSLRFFYGRDKCLSVSLDEGLHLTQYDSEANADTFYLQDSEIRKNSLKVGNLYSKENFVVAESDCTVSLQHKKPATWTFGVYTKIIKDIYKLSIFYRIPNCSSSLWYFVAVKNDKVVLEPFKADSFPSLDLYCFYGHQPTN